MYYGEKVCLRAYREEDKPIATSFVNDEELKKFLVTNIPFPMTLWEEEEWVRSRLIRRQRQMCIRDSKYSFSNDSMGRGRMGKIAEK